MTKKNIQSLSQFDVMDDSMLATVEGGDGILLPTLGFVVGTIYSYYAGEATASCRRNPNQWHCVRF